MDKENAEFACQIRSQQNWEAPTETNMRSSQTDVSFIVAILGSVCMFLNKSVNFCDLCHKVVNTDSTNGFGQNHLVYFSAIKETNIPNVMISDEKKQNRPEQAALSPPPERCFY